jgi:restriction system protein
MLGGKKKHLAVVAQAEHEFAAIHQQWQEHAAQIPARQRAQMNAYQAAEQQRLSRLQADKAAYDQQCRERQHQADEKNARLDQLIRDLAAGQAAAVEEYFGIVFGNSVYPDYFGGVSSWKFDPATGELMVSFEFPHPEQLPTVRQYRYLKAKDEITATAQTQKERRDRYAGVVHQTALRTLHEVWESDRAGHVLTIAFSGFVDHIDEATGHESHTTLVQLAVERDQFEQLDLGKVTPAETLKYLKANVSKNPLGLIGIDTGPGVRAH